MVKNDLVGRRFGRLVAVELLDTAGTHGGRLWSCRCDCGKVSDVPRGRLIDGSVQSCGCLRRDHAASLSATHGLSSSPEWMAWHSLRDRCNNPNNAAYAGYGGRGITVDPNWDSSFETFYNDVGPRPSSFHSLDRENVNGNYEPGNVRWVTGEIQQLNRRPSKRNQLGIIGVSPTSDGKFLARMRIGGKQVLNKTCDTLDEAINARREKEIEYLGHPIIRSL